ncbi:hypothetical protein F5Y15DRAFT_409415 [Xylariaceae sp. FL0016]|nr:hypothetical protein F5Y15DRAFT_409415 [Xylariaceae sp. FL0016]
MPMWTCDFAGCQNPSVRALGDCDEDAYKPAAREAERSEVTNLIRKINTRALETRASYLRHGVPCSIPPVQYDKTTQSSVIRGRNYHIEVCFDDGVKWIARIRRFNATSPPAVLRDNIVRSEVATLKFLERTNVPTPKVFDFALEDSNNPVGVDYILMEKLPGKSLRWSLANQEQKNKVMTHLADTLIELRKYPFDFLGSLDRPGESHVGAFAREILTDFTQSEMRTMGPFSSSEEYPKTSLQLILNMIIREEMYSQRPVDAYLIHRFLLDLVPTVLSSSAEHNNHRYYLKHAVDTGYHVLVDDDYNVTGIIDWEWAHTAPPAHAFNSPIGLLPVAEFYDGANDLGDDEVIFARLLEEKVHKDMADFVRKGRLQHRFIFCWGYDLEDWNGFLGLFQGLRDAVKVDNDLDWDGWRTVALKRYGDDPGLQTLLSRPAKTLDS